jgi:cytochrome P450
LSLRAVLEKHVIGGRTLTNDRDDLLAMLFLAQDQDGGMTDRQLRDEVMNFFLAGHETPSNGLAFVWYLLAQHPEVQAKLCAELDEVLDGRVPTVADVPRLRFTEMIVMEALRLYPPLWVIGRQSTEDCELGGYAVPAGSLIQMSQWVVHRDPRFYADPDSFNPKRWAERPLKTLPKYAYFPFSGGPRMCIGNSFAALEMALVIAMVAQRFRLAVAPGFSPSLLPSMTLRPAHGIRMVVGSRD